MSFGFASPQDAAAESAKSAKQAAETRAEQIEKIQNRVDAPAKPRKPQPPRFPSQPDAGPVSGSQPPPEAKIVLRTKDGRWAAAWDHNATAWLALCERDAEVAASAGEQITKLRDSTQLAINRATKQATDEIAKVRVELTKVRDADTVLQQRLAAVERDSAANHQRLADHVDRLTATNADLKRRLDVEEDKCRALEHKVESMDDRSLDAILSALTRPKTGTVIKDVLRDRFGNITQLVESTEE
jgi:hypothetical protein